MLIRVDQSNLNTSIKMISSLRISWNYVDFEGIWSRAYLSLLSSYFIKYNGSPGIVNCLDCIPDKDYIEEVSEIRTNTNAYPIPAGDLTLEFFQF